MRHDLLGAVIGQGDHRAALGHHLLGALGDGGEGIAGDVHGHREILGAGVDIAALEFGLVGIGDGVEQEVQLAPALFEIREHSIHGGLIGHVAGQHDVRAQRGRQRIDPLLQSLALIGEGKLGTLIVAGPCNAPGNGLVICQPHDEPAFA